MQCMSQIVLFPQHKCNLISMFYQTGGGVVPCFILGVGVSHFIKHGVVSSKGIACTLFHQTGVGVPHFIQGDRGALFHPTWSNHISSNKRLQVLQG